MRPSKALNLATFAVDVIHLCLLVYIAINFLIHIGSLAAPGAFDTAVRQTYGKFCDFRSYYAVGRVAASDEKANAMDPVVQKASYCRTATPPDTRCDDWSQIIYAPFFALAMIPFAQLPVQASFVCWSFVGISAFIAALMAIGFSQTPRRSWIAPVAIAVGLLAAMPTWRCAIIGQASFMIGTLLAFFYFAWMRGHDRLAGVLMAFTTFKPQFIPFTLVPALAQKKWAMLIVFAISEVILYGAVALFLGVKPITDFVSAMLNISKSALPPSWSDTFTMLSARALLSYLPKKLEVACAALIFLAVLGLLFWLWKRAQPLGNGESSRRLVAATIVATLAGSIFSQLYDAVILAVPAALTLATVGARNMAEFGWRSRLWWLSFYVYPISSWLAWTVLGRTNPMSYHYFTLLLIAQAALGVSLVLRPPAATPGVPADAESPQ